MGERPSGGLHDPEHDDQCERRDVERRPVGRGGVEAGELGAGRDLVEPREGDRRVGAEMHEVPHLVRQPTLGDHERAEADDDQEDGADRRRDHARVGGGEQRLDLRWHRDPVIQRVADCCQDDVREDEVEAGFAVEAVPDGEPVEADEPLEPGQPREQQHLHERQVGADHAGHSADAVEDVAGAGGAAQAAGSDPEPDAPGAVAENDEPQGEGSRPPVGRGPRPPQCHALLAADQRDAGVGHGRPLTVSRNSISPQSVGDPAERRVRARRALGAGPLRLFRWR